MKVWVVSAINGSEEPETIGVWSYKPTKEEINQQLEKELEPLAQGMYDPDDLDELGESTEADVVQQYIDNMMDEYELSDPIELEVIEGRIDPVDDSFIPDPPVLQRAKQLAQHFSNLEIKDPCIMSAEELLEDLNARR